VRTAGTGRDRAGGGAATGDVAEYLAAAGGFLRSRAAENTVQLGATETIRVRGAAAFEDEAPLFGCEPSL
jgi:hypothetical protein